MDPLELKDYSTEEFKYEAPKRIRSVGDELKDIMGTSRDIMPKGLTKYEKYFDEDDYEDKQKGVVIPEYAGPKNTRVDTYKLENGRFQIEGMVNHAQASCVYLMQDVSIQFDVELQAEELDVDWRKYRDMIRPFSIQRQFDKLHWGSQQVSSRLDINIQQHVKLAPYLCDKKILENQIQNKRITYKTDGIGNRKYVNFNYRFYEPLLGFQTGYSILKAARPFNQQNMMYPLAIQDYQIQVEQAPKDYKLAKRVFRDPRLACTDYEPDDLAWNNMEEAVVNVPVQGANFDALNVNHFIRKLEYGEINLVSFSEDNATQANKSVSEVLMHAPIFHVFKTQPYTIDLLANTGIDYENIIYLQQEKTGPGVYVPNDNPTLNRLPIILKTDVGKELKIQCNTSKGFPSYFLIYLEDFGTKYTNVNSRFTNATNPATGIPFNDIAVDTDYLIGSHPKIYQLTIKIFGQDIPITKKMSIDELEYLTRKNCHSECDFEREMSFDPIVFLKLEDLGLGTEELGYPNIKRLEMEVQIDQILLPFRSDLIAAGGDISINAYACFVYENHVLEGNNDRLDFLWRMV